MELREVIKGLETVKIKGETDTVISSISSDSRDVTGNSVFVAVRGVDRDGHEFIDDAVKRGAVAIISEKEDLTVKTDNVTTVIVRDSRDALAFVSSRFYGSPSESLIMIGITGTNGKTTTSYLIREILERSGKKTGLTGTIRNIVGDREIDANFTTPEPMKYQELLADMQRGGCEYVISEVSSHALAQKRVDHTIFARAVFTNLSRDHLDYHESMENYLESKKRLFTDLLDRSGIAILNSDDICMPDIRKDIKQHVITYGIESDADVMARDIVQDFNGMSFTVICNGNEHQVTTRMIGRPNTYNILAAVATSISLDVPIDVIIQAISETDNVDGRFETVLSSKGVLFVIDYAHTPDALDKLLETVQSLPHQKIITVFGCGGNRDRGKRPLMGRIASDRSDYVVVTSDNPRYEDPETIIQDTREGMHGEYVAITEREDAIREAVSIAERGDVVVVAGKGHENYQEIKGIRHPMSDKEIISRAIDKPERD
jgi:UDP-N-acetylmuramoyl-L-alanyl-D-glutamate--2,6-diaminopimelate ligase